MYGDFAVDEFGVWEWIMFLFSSILITLVLLNLLIAIISDTYDRVQEQLLPADYMERAQLLLEVERLLIMKRDQGIPRYLFLVKQKQLEEDENFDWEGRIRSLKNYMEFRFQEFSTDLKDIKRSLAAKCAARSTSPRISQEARSRSLALRCLSRRR